MKSLATLTAVTWAALFILSTASSQETKPPSKGIDTETIAAYKKLGAAYGGWVRSSSLCFELGNGAAERGVPGFAFGEIPKAKLPPIAIPWTLSLRGFDVTEANLKEVAALPNLVALDLRETKITNEGLRELSGLKNLTALSLNRTKVTDTGMKELAVHKNLVWLNLFNTEVTHIGLKALAPCAKLDTLFVNAKLVTDESIKVLAEIKLLHSLETAGAKNGARPNSAEDVTYFDLRETLVTDVGLKDLAVLKNLTILIASYSKLTDKGLKELAVFKNLAGLNLSETKITDAGLRELAALKTLTSVTLGGTKVTNAGIAELRKALPKCDISR